ncbi:MAG TPA: hypothetical protein VMS64_31385 [Candidatus Methylomirabilis sp.]|nr:hypothetical protein [Candidatus Methylomirabilis sp.]
MVRPVAALLVMVMTVTTGCGTSDVARRPSAALLAGVNRLAVVVEGDSTFRVTAERAGGDVGPLAFAGGAGLGGGFAALVALVMLVAVLVANAQMQRAAAVADAGRAATIRPLIPGLSPRAIAVDTFAQTLRAGGRFEIEVLESEPGKDQRQRFDAVVLLRFPEWGFQSLRANDPSLAAFVAVDARMVRSGRGESLWEQKDTVFGHGRQTLDELAADPELMRRELKDALETAGYRLAVELLYPRGKP